MARRGEQTTRSRREIYCRKPSMLATTDRRGGGGGRRAAGWVLIDLREGVRTGVTGGGGRLWAEEVRGWRVTGDYGRLRGGTGTGLRSAEMGARRGERGKRPQADRDSQTAETNQTRQQGSQPHPQQRHSLWPRMPNRHLCSSLCPPRRPRLSLPLVPGARCSA